MPIQQRDRPGSSAAEPPPASGKGRYRVGPAIKTGLIQTETRGPLAVQYTEVDGDPLVEGDIVLSLIPPASISAPPAAGDPIAEGIVIPGAAFRWPDGLVPFDIDPNLPNPARVTDAIAHWERNTRIRFVRRTAANAGQFPDFVFFQPADGCSSNVGRQTNRQNINLAAGCGLIATIHEIGHAVGLWHEQSREDRDAFVIINWANIAQQHAHNFNQHITDGDDVGPYDYHSIMHYARGAFSQNNQDTITPRQPIDIGQQVGLSPGDCAAVRSIYAGLEPAAVFRGMQFRGTLAGGAVGRWFTHSWPAQWYVVWTVVPTAPAVDGPAQLESKVQVTRQSGGLLKYFLEVRNLTGGAIDFEARYDVLGWSPAAL